MSEPVKITQRNLPHWSRDRSIYFITFRLAQGELTPERTIVLDHLNSGDPPFYELIAAVVMPDHVHLIVRPNLGIELSRMTKGMNGVSAKKVNAHRGVSGSLWQDESFDRRIRDADEFARAWNYISENPVKTRLADRPEAYPWLSLSPEH